MRPGLPLSLTSSEITLLYLHPSRLADLGGHLSAPKLPCGCKDSMRDLGKAGRTRLLHSPEQKELGEPLYPGDRQGLGRASALLTSTLLYFENKTVHWQ